MSRTPFALGLAVTTIAASAMVLELRASGENLSMPESKIAFPENYGQGVMYMSVNRPVNPKSSTGLENIARADDFYITPAALEALRRGEPTPNGTVITRVQYRTELDTRGNPVTDAGGRFIRGALFGFAVMEKRTGWGTDYPPEKRNGEWEYQAFTPDRKPNPKAKLESCFHCHKPLARTDFLFSIDKIRALGARMATLGDNAP